MFRHGFSLSLLLSLAVMCVSIGVDIRTILFVKPQLSVTPAARIAFPLPGPRRYPPAYHAASLATPS